MKVCVIGQGYVGLTVAIASANAGHEVIGFDINNSIILELSKGISHIPGIDFDNLNSLIRTGKYVPSSDFNLSHGSDALIITVPTPLNYNNKPDLTLLIRAVEMIRDNFRNNALVINESTSYPGTLRNLIGPILESSNEVKYLLATAPERVDPGNTIWNIKNTPRVLAGINSEATELAFKFYKSFCDEVHVVSSPEIAEASKTFENTFRHINIALVNEFSEVAANLGFSAHEAIMAAATKPYGFMPFFPGIGVGGHCIPIDPTYLSHISEEKGLKFHFVDLANEINITRPKQISRRLLKEFENNLNGIKIQVVGISYKPNIPDLRESPALNFIRELRDLGADVIWHDPLVISHGSERSQPLRTDIDIGIILVPHNTVDLAVWQKSNLKIWDLSANSTNYGWPKTL